MDLRRYIEAGGEIDGKVVVVLAHPDDETASAGGLLQRLADARLIYLTDGAPRDLRDARRKGFGDWQGYAAHRKRELRSALDALGVDRTPLFLDCPDKQALDYLEALVGRLAAELVGADAVVSHAYEHGHPDHDTAALAVALARRRHGNTAPPAFEFAGYHLGSEGPVCGQFWGGGGTRLRLTPAELGRKRAAIDAYSSQRETLALFPLQPERFRAAPDYDFARAAPPGRALYDVYGWAVTSQAWRDSIAEPVR